MMETPEHRDCDPYGLQAERVTVHGTSTDQP